MPWYRNVVFSGFLWFSINFRELGRFVPFCRYFGFDAGDPIYDRAGAAKHLSKEFVASALEVGNRARAGNGGVCCEGNGGGLLWYLSSCPGTALAPSSSARRGSAKSQAAHTRELKRYENRGFGRRYPQ